jgi:hypothetical protein
VDISRPSIALWIENIMKNLETQCGITNYWCGSCIVGQKNQWKICNIDVGIIGWKHYRM